MPPGRIGSGIGVGDHGHVAPGHRGGVTGQKFHLRDKGGFLPGIGKDDDGAALERFYRRAARAEIAPRLEAATARAGTRYTGLTIRGLAIYVGVVLLVGGLARIASGWRGSTDERLIAVISGLVDDVEVTAGENGGLIRMSWPTTPPATALP